MYPSGVTKKGWAPVSTVTALGVYLAHGPFGVEFQSLQPHDFPVTGDGVMPPYLLVEAGWPLLLSYDIHYIRPNDARAGRCGNVVVSADFTGLKQRSQPFL